ncbi:transcriptional regulator [[Bacillus thuringiensis] serovar konkukian]|nr:helix-turn-helix transcriptional regulator [Bacillus thuringiensis]MED1303088.1 helix-turn-helix transcriptional regulator [Bacillus pacificus]OUB07699.1 transcriptional regulator [[Bacillus thuringiensis] serovar konkukian]
MELKDRIRTLRKKHNLKQGELGEAIGINAASVSKFETGLKSPSRETLERIANFFNVTVDYLLGRSYTPELNTMLDRKYKELKDKLEEFPEDQQEILLKQMQIMMQSFEELNNLTKK